jgi:hypothetical protein
MTLRSFAVALAVAVTATIAPGQQCVLVIESSPGLRSASIAIGMIADNSPRARPAEKPAIFRRALTQLYETSAGPTNQIASRYLLGRLYAVWVVVNQPGTRVITTRGDLALPGGDPGGMHDLHLAMDSAFAKVEAEIPACADSTARYRRAVSQIAFNDARVQLAARNLDSAVVLAKRALVADPGNAVALQLIAEATRQRRDTVSVPVRR